MSTSQAELEARVDALLTASDGLQRACVIKRGFGPELLTEIDVAAMLDEIAAGSSSRALRAFDAGRQDPRLTLRLLEHPPAGKGLRAWLAEHSGSDHAGLVVDNPPLTGRDLDVRLGPWLAAIEARIGCPPGGIEPHVFVGDYGWTPFGMHHDEGVGRVVHFHLGPGVKHVYLLTTDEFTALTGGRRTSFDLERLAAHAQEFVLEPGDVFVLPSAGYHVGRTAGFATALALCWSDASERELVGRGAQELIATELSDAQPYPWLQPHAPAERSLAPQAEPLSLADAATLRVALLRSNLGLDAPPPLIACPPLLDTDRLRRRGRFPIEIAAVGGLWAVCARGRFLRLPEDAGLRTLVARFNADAIVNVADALAALDGFEADAARFVLETLVSHRALERLDPQS